MRARCLLAVAVLAGFLGQASAAEKFDWSKFIWLSAENHDWSEFIWDAGLDTTVSLLKGNAVSQGDEITGRIAGAAEKFGIWTQITEFGLDTTLRKLEYKEPFWQAGLEQTLIDFPSLALSKVLGDGLSACFASGPCAIVDAGAGVTLGTGILAVGIAADAYFVGKAIELQIDLWHEHQEYAAMLQQVKDLQEQLDAQRTPKPRRPQHLDVQFVTPDVPARPPSPLKVPPKPWLYFYQRPRPDPAALPSANSDGPSDEQLEDLKRKAAALKPPPKPDAPARPAYVPPSPVQPAQPGGISLSIAAAMRMRLPATLQGVDYDKGRLVLSGRTEAQSDMDAALLLTGMRAACEPGDPYFSLDPDGGAAWGQQTDQVFHEFWDRIRGGLDIGGRDGWQNRLPLGFHVTTILASRDYAALWRELSVKYPALRSRLVFRPLWLRDTRFGEILYNADVLLKELSTGAPVLGEARAQRVEGYVAADSRRVADILLSRYEHGAPPPASGQQVRLWFDLFPQAGTAAPPRIALRPSSTSNDPAAANLRRILASLGYERAPAQGEPSALAKDGDVIDLSTVYPQMFIRRHDLASGKDLPGNDPDLDQLASDVNGRTAAYVNSYAELSALTNVFRAYLVAVSIVEKDRGTCDRVRAIPLLPAEKVDHPLPPDRPSELTITLATYVYTDGQKISLASANVRAMNGGISLRGKSFFAQRLQSNGATPQTLALRQEIAKGLDRPVRDIGPDQRLVALSVDDGALLRELGNGYGAVPATPEQVLDAQNRLLRARADAAAENAARRDYEQRLHAWEAEQQKYADAQRAWQEADRRWREADELWRRAELKAGAASEDRPLREKFGPPIDAVTASVAVRFAPLLSDDASSRADAAAAGWRRLSEWKAVLKRSGYSDRQIDALARAGFAAAVYADQRTGEVAIAYAGRRVPRAAVLDDLGDLSQLDLQYKAAADLAWIVRNAVAADTVVTATGTGFGGALAQYAGEGAALSRVVTFNAAGASAFTAGPRPSWIDIVWARR